MLGLGSYWYTHSAGYLYQHGRDLFNVRNYKNALPLLIKAANQGDVDAKSLLGFMYTDPIFGVKPDNEKALSLFQEAAQKNQPMAQYGLGNQYDGKDSIKSLYWYKRALPGLTSRASEGDPLAQAMLALMYGDGDGVEQNDKQMAYWLRKSAENNLAEAQSNLGDCYETGENKYIAKDTSQAINWYRKAAKQGHSDAQIELKKLGKTW